MLNVIRKVSTGYIDEDTIQVGYQIQIPLDGFGTFTATAEEVTDGTILFIFDDIVSRKPMNVANTNAGGLKGSQLYKWLQDVLLPAFPDYLRERILELTIPTIGQVFGWSDAWDKKHFVSDDDQQLPLMKNRKHRMASFEGDIAWYWLQNASCEGWSSASFAGVYDGGNAYYAYASNSDGIRPAFCLVKEKSWGRVPRGNRVSDQISKEALMREINEKASEIDILTQKLERLEKNRQYDESANEVKTLVDSFIRAGFTEEQEFRMVMNIMMTILGGL